MRSTREPGRPLARVAAVVEQLALSVWIGSLIGFAFLSAPTAFHVVKDMDQFATLTASVLGQLSILGYFCCGIAILATILRSIGAADRTWDLVRVALLLVAIGGVVYEAQAIIPAMAAMHDFNSDTYRQLHGEATRVYGGVVILGLLAIVIAASRGID
jgi:hypothetical protein